MIYSNSYINRRKSVIKSRINNFLINFKETKPLSPLFYGIGLPRSGTHSLAHAFEDTYCAAHEPWNTKTIYLVLAYKKGLFTKSDIVQILKYRQSKLNLEVESSHYLHYLAAELSEIYPQTKFILTIREPMAWIRSELRKNALTAYPHWKELQDFRYLDEKNIVKSFTDIPHSYSIESYLRYWKSHIQYCIENIPSNRLFIVETKEIIQKKEEIASFLNIDSSNINTDKMWSGKGNPEVKIQKIPEEKVKERIKSYLHPFIMEYLPDFATTFCRE